ncbi:hypothetical protein ACQP3J_28035, partial [Escherichia coli]
MLGPVNHLASREDDPGVISNITLSHSPGFAHQDAPEEKVRTSNGYLVLQLTLCFFITILALVCV